MRGAQGLREFQVLVMASTDLAVRGVTSVEAVDRAAWDALDHGPSPFLRHGFLTALEASGSIGKRSGWRPVYLLAQAGGQLQGAVAAFVKQHSYGDGGGQMDQRRGAADAEELRHQRAFVGVGEFVVEQERGRGGRILFQREGLATSPWAVTV